MRGCGDNSYSIHRDGRQHHRGKRTTWSDTYATTVVHSQSADLRQGCSGPDPESGLTWLSQFNGDSIPCSNFKDTYVVKFSRTSDPLFQRYEPKWGEVPRLALLKSSWKIPRSGSRSRWLTIFNQFFPVQGHFSGQISTKIRSVVLTWSCKQTDRQTNEQTDKRRLYDNLLVLGGGNNGAGKRGPNNFQGDIIHYTASSKSRLL